MRVMVKFWFPTESGNDAIRSGKVQKVMEQIVEDLKPEAAYFFLDDGVRSGFFIVDMGESWQVADTVERFFFGLNANVALTPVMNGEDLQKALAGIPGTVERYG